MFRHYVNWQKNTKANLKSLGITSFGANEVVIYNFLALLTIDTNINQFIKVYHIFYKIQYQYKKIYKIYKNNKKPRFKSEEEQVCSFLQQS